VLQLRHAAGHHVHDGLHVLVAQAPALGHADHHRGAGLAAIPHEDRLAGQRQVDPGGFHLPDGGDGAGQLGLQGAVKAGALHELAGAERGVFLQGLEAEAAAPGQPLGGQLQAGRVDLVGGHADGTGALLHAVGDALLVQLLDDGGGVLVVQLAEQGAVAGLLRPEVEHHPGTNGEQQHHREAQAHQVLPPAQHGLQLVHPRNAAGCAAHAAAAGTTGTAALGHLLARAAFRLRQCLACLGHCLPRSIRMPSDYRQAGQTCMLETSW